MLTRETLIDRVWGPDYVGDTKTLDVHIKRLRAKVEADPASPSRIVTIRGLGYKYEAPEGSTRAPVGRGSYDGLVTTADGDPSWRPARAAADGGEPASGAPAASSSSPFTRLARTHAAAGGRRRRRRHRPGRLAVLRHRPGAARRKVALYLLLTMRRSPWWRR